jgi:hypothetical protein
MTLIFFSMVILNNLNPKIFVLSNLKKLFVYFLFPFERELYKITVIPNLINI